MKKIFVTSLLALTSVAFLPIVNANPVSTFIQVRCPISDGGGSQLQNFGTYVAGYGEENIQGLPPNPVYFKSGTISNLPTNLNQYVNSAANYIAGTGDVVCSYISNDNTQPPFSLSYTLTNAKGGVVRQQQPFAVTIELPIGFK